MGRIKKKMRKRRLMKTRKRKIWKREKRQLHGEIIERIDRYPEALGIRKEEVLYKKMNPEFVKEGRPTIDNIFLTEKEDRYEIFLVEVKVGSKQGRKAEVQMEIAQKFFFRNWRKWLKEKLDTIREKEVWLTLLPIYCDRDPFSQFKDFIFGKESIKLGKIMLSAEEAELGKEKKGKKVRLQQ